MRPWQGFLLNRTLSQGQFRVSGLPDGDQRRSRGRSSAAELSGNFLADAYILLTYDWDSAGARTALAGAVVGRVRRQAWGGGQQAGQVQYEPVEGAVVSGSDAEGNALQSGNALIAISQKDGTYTLWDSAYQGGTVTVHALAGNETATGVGFEGNPQDVSASWGPFQTLRFYQNKAHVDVVFEAQAPPPPTPDVDIVVMRDADGVDTRGLSAAGVPLRIGFKNNRQGESVTIGSLDINGANFTVTTDSSGKFAGITQNVWTPAQPGTYILTTTALSPIGGSIPLSTTVRIVAAGGNVDTDQAQPPRVVDQQTYPKRGARNVQTSIFPTITFSEPVVNITHSTVQLTRVDSSTAGPVLPTPIADAIKISGVTSGNQVIDDVTTAPTLPFTSITIRPLNGLKYRQQYTLTLTDGIRDLDTTEGAPAPKSLVPYATTFDTFGPESIPPDGEPASTTTTGFYVAKNANGEPVSMWSLKHQIIGANWQALLTGYDLDDPVNVVETSSLGILGRPIDLAGDGSLIAVATAPGVKSIPSNVRLYDVSNPLSPLWVGAASLTKSLDEGTVNRITLRGNRAYAGTYRKGIQMLDVDAMKSALPPCCEADHVKVISDLNLDQKGFNEAAIIATVPVPGPGGQASYFTGLKSIAQSAEPLVVAIGNFGLALARESSPGATLYRGTPSRDGETLQYGLALDVANVEGYDLAVVAAASGAKQVLMVVDVTNPDMPVVRSVRDIAAGDRGVVDVLVNGTVVYVPTQKATTPPSLGVEVFDISDPDTIAHLGHIAGVGGRLSIVGKLLYGATSGTFGAPIDGLGGVRSAALGTLALIEGTNPPVVVVGEGPRAAEDFSIKYRVIPASVEVESAQIEYRHEEATVGTPLNAPFSSPGRGEVPLSFGFTFPTVGENVAQSRLKLRTTEGEEVAGPLRSWRLEQPTVELVFDDDQDEETVTADKPEVEVRVTSTEWYRRFVDAQEKLQPLPPTQDVMFASVVPGGVVSPNQIVSRDGIFETSLANLIAPAAGHQVRAFIGPVTLGVSDPATVVSGPAHSLDLTSPDTDLPLDGASEVLITLVARDIRGNPVLDGTGVFWETDGDGEFVEPLEATSNGTATIKYRAGESKAGPVTITAHVDDVEQAITLQQHPVQVVVDLDHAEAFLDTPSIEVTATATSLGGAISPKAAVSAISSSGKMTIIAPLVNGVLRARWEPAGAQYRYRLAFSVAVADARGQSSTIPWRATLTPQGSSVEEATAAGPMDSDSATVAAFSAPAAQQEGEVIPVASAFPSVIAGDKTQDGTYALELPDGTTRALPYKTQSSYRITGLTPGERVALTLGSNARPNARSVVYYSGTQGLVNGLAPDDVGQNDGTATVGVQSIPLAYQGPGYSFDGAGTITIPNSQPLAFASGFMVQVAVRPPPLSNGTLIERAGQFRLDLVNGYPRFTTQSGSAIGLPAESSVTASQPIPENQWTLVSGRFDGTVIKLVAGDYEETLVLSQPPNASASPIVIGQGFGGALDEVRILDLSAGPLLTFAGGATEIQGVADPLGNFETVIRSGGALVADILSSSGRFADAFAHDPDDSGRSAGPSDSSLELMHRGEFLALLQEAPPTASQEAAGGYVVEVNAIFADSARRETSFIGVASSEMLARGFLVIGGIWGAGPPDDPYVMAGDIVLGTFVQVITSPRDFINAFDHARTGQADKFEILTIAMAAAAAASVVFSKKAAILGKMRKLPQLLTAFGPAAEANRVLGKRLLKGVKEISDDLPGGKSLENIAEAVDVLSMEGRQALANVLNAVGDRGRSLDKLDALIRMAPDKDGVVRALDDARRSLSPRQFASLLSVTTSCAIGAAAQDGVGAACEVVNLRALGALARAMLRGVPVNSLHRLATRNGGNFGSPNRTLERLADLFDLEPPAIPGLDQVISELGHPRINKAGGVLKALEVAHDLVAATQPSARASLGLSFELREPILGVMTSKGRQRSRVYDVVFTNNGRRIRAEVKRYTVFPPALGGAHDQFLRDVALYYRGGLDVRDLRWVLVGRTPGEVSSIANALIGHAAKNPSVRRLLNGPGQFAAFQRDLLNGTLFQVFRSSLP